MYTQALLPEVTPSDCACMCQFSNAWVPMVLLQTPDKHLCTSSMLQCWWPLIEDCECQECQPHSPSQASSSSRTSPHLPQERAQQQRQQEEGDRLVTVARLKMERARASSNAHDSPSEPPPRTPRMPLEEGWSITAAAEPEVSTKP